MAYPQYNYSSGSRQEPSRDTEAAFPSSQSSTSSSHHTFHVSQSSHATRRGKGSQPKTRRSVVEDFRLLVLLPTQHLDKLQDYVGADSRYTAAGTHAGLYVRHSVKSPEFSARLREAAAALEDICGLLRFVQQLPKENLKLEQKGCFTLRVCFCSLTALLGDFSGGIDIPASDPQAPIVPRDKLSHFRSYFPQIQDVLRSLSAGFVEGINTYKHRRSPSGSVVTKLWDILGTLKIWNDALGDGTFHQPTNIIETWLRNHRSQVDGSRRARAPSAQSSPLPESRSSPSHYDSAIFPMDMYSPNQSSSGAGLPSSVAGMDYLSPHTSYLQPSFEFDSSPPTFYAATRQLDHGPHPQTMGYTSTQDPDNIDLNLELSNLYSNAGGPGYRYS